MVSSSIPGIGGVYTVYYVQEWLDWVLFLYLVWVECIEYIMFRSEWSSGVQIFTWYGWSIQSILCLGVNGVVVGSSSIPGKGGVYTVYYVQEWFDWVLFLYLVWVECIEYIVAPLDSRNAVHSIFHTSHVIVQIMIYCIQYKYCF